MRINKSLITFTPTSGSGSGTVTSVAMTVPGGLFTVTGTPITSSGTFVVGLVNQLANTVWAGPVSGAESVPTFRGLVSDDIPNLSATKITSGTLVVARGGTGATTLTGLLIGNGTSTFTGIASTTANQLLRVNSSGTAYEWFTPDYLSNVMTSLGDIIYGNAVGLPVKRSGNTTTTKMYLSQTGDGTNSAAPQWSAISVGEVSGAVSALTGEVSTTGSGSLNVTLGTTAVTGKLLTGLSVTSGAIASTDSILSAFGKVQGQINGLAGGSTYKGSWNASTNTPTIVSGTGTTGDYYIVSTAGSTTIDGVSSWDIGDWIIFSGTVWQKIDNTDSVISVNGQVGSVVLTTANITENTNLYYTDTRARNAISLTTTGASGAATYTSGVLNVPNYTLSGLGGIGGSGTPGRIPKFTASDTIGNSIMAESSGIINIYGAGQIYTSQAGAGQSNFYISNEDTTAAINHQTLLSTQQIGSGLGRTIIYAAAYSSNKNRGELSILSENGSQYVANFGTILSSGDNAFSLFSTSAIENIRLNTGGNSWLMGGNVGIGINNPTAKLEINTNVNAASTPAATLTLSNIADGGHRILFKNGAGNLAAIDGDITTSGAGTDDGVLRFWTSVNGTLAQNMSILSGGQLKLNQYTSSTSFSGTIAGLLAFDSSGNVITTNLAGVGGVPTTRTITINGTSFDLSANRTYNVGTVTSVAALTLGTTGTDVSSSVASGTTTPVITLNIPTASASNRGVLSSADWTTFNNKQNTLTNPVTGNGAGAIGYFPIFSGVNAIENSSLFQSGTGLYYGGGSASEYSLQIGNGRTGNGYAYIDLIGDATHTDYGMRMIRGNTGANTTSTIEHRGTGDFILKSVDTGTFKVQVASTDVLSIISTGAATFSSSVTAATLTTTRATTGTNNYLQFLTGATTNWQIGTASSLTALSFLDAGVEALRLDTGGIVSVAGNFAIGGATFGTSATRTLAITNGVAPTTSVTDRFQMYSADVVAGNAAPHFRTENGAVIKLYQETTSVGSSTLVTPVGSVVRDTSTFDGYTLQQVVQALRNQGILA